MLHDRNLTLKETVLRRRRTTATVKWALRHVDLDVAPGESVGIIGQNGSGKSTLLKMLAGILPPQTGTVEIGGSVAAMLELGAGFHPDFTGRENVYMNGAIHGLSERQVGERLDEIVAFSELEDFIDMPVRTYSSGMSMRLAFAISSHVHPDVLLLDEVLAVGDEAFQRKCMGRIADFRRGGGTLVFVSHDPNAVERVCDRAILLVDGDIAADGDPQDVLATYHRLIASDGGDTGTPASGEDEWGTRQVELRNPRVEGPGGVTDRFLTGQPFAIVVDVLAPEPVATPIFGISIHTMEGMPVYATNTLMDSLAIDEIAGTGTMRFEVPSLPLREGAFTVSAAVVSHDQSVVYHWLERQVAFSVFATGPGTGPVDMSGTWRLQGGERPASGPAQASRVT